MAAGFPEGTPLRRAMNFTYNHVAPLQFLRTTYKAGPLLALALAGLGGLAAARAAPWLRARGRALPVVALTGLAALAAVACWPLVRGQALDSRLTWDRVPPAWTAAADHVDATVGRTGGRSCCPASSTRTTTGAGRSTRSCPRSPSAPSPCATRCPTPTCARSTCCGRSTGSCSSAARCPASSGRCWTCCRRARWWRGPTITAPAAGRSAPPTPPTCSTSSAPPTRPGGRCGASRARRARSAPARPLPRVRAGTAPAPGRWCAWSRTRARPSSTAAPTRSRVSRRSGRCPAAGSPTRATGRPPRSAGRGEVVISDSNRRRVLVAARMAQNHGVTLAADDPFSPDAARARPVPGARRRRADGGGLRRRPLPAHAVLARLLAVPRAAAVRGLRRRHRDHWQADRALEEARHWLEIGFERAARRRLDRAAAVLRPAREGDGRRGRRAGRSR